MSVSTMVETYDMPMTDYIEDGDIPMAASSSENWFQPLLHMDEDAHHIDITSEAQEVDMMAFEETTTEYEMADEATQPHEAIVDANVIDAEVYDVTFHSSPLPPVPTEITENHSVQLEIPQANAATADQQQVEANSHLTSTHDTDSTGTRPFPLSHEVQTHDALPVVTEAYSSRHASVTTVPENGHEHTEHTGESTVPVLLPEEVADAVEVQSVVPSELVAGPLHSEGSEERPDGDHDGQRPGASTEALANKETASNEHAEDEDALRASQADEEGSADAEDDAIVQPDMIANQQAYTQPPPPIILSLQVTSNEGDQPDFVLFSLPEASSHTTEEPLLLLQHHPSLFYEPVSAVFQAFRQEEYFSHLEELSEAEMALNAHELQLVISEDNIYAREVSLQDLHAMHQGVGLPGHLRLTLQSIVPRFIARYNLLRDQITRLVLNDGVEEIQQQAGHIADEEEELEAQEQVNSHESQQDLEHDHNAANLESVEENESNEDVEEADKLEANDGQDAPDHNEEGAPETEEDSNDIGQNTSYVDPDDADRDQDERDEEPSGEPDDEDASGETDDEVDDLGADALHAKTSEDDAEPPLEEHETEYVEVAEPREEGDEGYDDEFREDVVEGMGTTEDTADPTVLSENDRPEAHDEGQQDAVPEPNDGQSDVISHSTSSSSLDADDSSWEDAAEENDVSTDLGEETNQSIQQSAATIFDEEGNYTEEFEEVRNDEFGGEDFGEEDFEESAEGTLKDSTEEAENLTDDADGPKEVEKDDDATSRAVLAESEKFVSTLENEGEVSGAAETKTTSNDGGKSHTGTVEAVADEARMVYKNTSKRSLDDAELDDEELDSPPSSTGSKRTRTLRRRQH